MKKKLLACSAALLLPLALAFADVRPVRTARDSAANTFVREPAVVYTRIADGFGGSNVNHTSLIVYDDGFVSYSRAFDPVLGPPPRSFVVVLAPSVVRQFLRDLVAEGAAVLPDAPFVQPGGSTLTILEPGPDTFAHTFSYGAFTYLELDQVIQSFIATHVDTP